MTLGSLRAYLCFRPCVRFTALRWAVFPAYDNSVSIQISNRNQSDITSIGSTSNQRRLYEDETMGTSRVCIEQS